MKSILRGALLLPLPVLLQVPLFAQETRGATRASAAFEDYRQSVGRMDNGVLRITLDVGTAPWQPWGKDGPTVQANVFAADGAPPRVPGPLIRVTAGTPIHITLRNTLPDSIVVRGLRDRSNEPQQQRLGAFLNDFVELEPGGTKEVRFTPTVQGTFAYFATRHTAGGPKPPFTPTRGPFEGVMIIDPPGEPAANERIFLITHWLDKDLPGSWQPTARFMINGRSWPHTEHLTHAVGDTVRWRVINITGIPHPMHLHGFHFRVDARGNQWREEVYAPADRRMAVTELLNPNETMRITWVPTEPGNWVFHCHRMRHMSWLQTAPLEHATDKHHASAEDVDLLGGMVLGITVTARAEVTKTDSPRLRLPLHIGMKPGVFGDAPAYGFVLQEGPRPPTPDSVRFPGSTIVLTRGEPSEIVVHNRADVPLGVHWHGLELESAFDGVPGVSGFPGATRPAIAPGDSFVVRMTPPRAGTFMYHVHSEPGHQLAQGMYGAFLVMEPGKEWDPERDRLFLLGSLGATLDADPAVNGRTTPDSVALRAGTTYRLRFMHISPDDDKRVQLLKGNEPVTWRAVAKDGADLPRSLVKDQAATFAIGVGETYDFLWTPDRAGDFTLRILTAFQAGPPAFRPPGSRALHTANITFHVR